VLALCVAGGCTPVDHEDIPDRGVREQIPRPAEPVEPPAPERVEPEPVAPEPSPDAIPLESCFRAPVTTPLSFSPGGSVTADVNADAVLDYVTFRDELIDGEFVEHIDTYLGARDGSFRLAGSAPYAGGGLGVAFDYLDEDSHLDMITGDHETSSFTEWMGDGEGGFRPGYVRKIGSSPHMPLMVDLDHDGRRDLLVPRYRVIEVYLSGGTGEYRPMPWIKVAASQRIATPEGLSIADLNADGNPDLIAPLSDDNALTVYMGSGNGKFRRRLRFEHPCSSPQASAVAHFDEDEHLDVAVGCGEKKILIYRGDGSGELELAWDIVPPGYMVDLVAADATGDGQADLVVSGYAFDPGDHSAWNQEHRGYVAVFDAGRTSAAGPWANAPVGMHYTHGLQVDDVDDDGIADVMFSGGGGTPSSHLGVLFGRECAGRGRVGRPKVGPSIPD
jgi:hypothetical protein